MIIGKGLVEVGFECSVWIEKRYCSFLSRCPLLLKRLRSCFLPEMMAFFFARVHLFAWRSPRSSYYPSIGGCKESRIDPLSLCPSMRYLRSLTQGTIRLVLALLGLRSWQAITNRLGDGFYQESNGGGGGSRTRVRKPST
jgi:hypothetical protein